jgi:hypothetical protein
MKKELRKIIMTLVGGGSLLVNLACNEPEQPVHRSTYSHYFVPPATISAYLERGSIYDSIDDKVSEKEVLDYVKTPGFLGYLNEEKKDVNPDSLKVKIQRLSETDYKYLLNHIGRGREGVYSDSSNYNLSDGEVYKRLITEGFDFIRTLKDKDPNLVGIEILYVDVEKPDAIIASIYSK